MAKGAGIGSKLAVFKGTTWGTATNVNRANAAIDYLSAEIDLGIPEFIDDASVSRSWSGDPIRGNLSSNVTLRAYLRYTSLEFLLAQPLGAAAVSAGLAGVYAHRYTYTSETYGTFGTLAQDKGLSIHELPSVKFSGYTITGQAGRPTEIQVRGLANNSVLPATKNTTLASATPRTQSLHVLWAEQSLLVAAKAGGAPTSTTDAYQPASYELAYDRPLASHFVMNNSAQMIEPIIDGNPTGTLRVTFPRYATAPAGTPGNFFINAAKANTALKLWLRGVGPTISGTSTRHRFDLYAPNAFVANVVTNVAGPNAIPQEVTINLKSAASPPTGLPSWIGAGGFALRLVNGVVTSPLAG
jgi:hypothetical protein